MRPWWRLARFRRDNGRLVVYGWLTTRSNAANPQVLGKQYNEAANEDMARTMAHRFADEIIYAAGRRHQRHCRNQDLLCEQSHRIKRNLGDGLRRRRTSTRSRTWAAFRFRRASRLIIRDIAFASLGNEGWAIRMFSLDLGRMVSFPAGVAGGSNLSPAWSAGWIEDRIFFGAVGRLRISGSPIASGGNAHKVTSFRPECFAGLESAHQYAACICERAHRRAADLHHGSGRRQRAAHDRQRLCDLAVVVAERRHAGLRWNRKYGPGDPGGQDIYVMDIASKNWLQVTHESGNNDFPSWSPDGRHIVFQRPDRRTARRSGRCWPTAPSSSN